MKITALAEKLEDLGVCNLKWDEPIAPYTSYRIGGPAKLWIEPQSEAEVAAVLRTFYEVNSPVTVIGRGSNVLVADQGIDGAVLHIGENFSDIQFKGNEATILAGTLLQDLIEAAVDRGLSGMEQLAGIPGGIGGALRMNAGAFGAEIELVTRSVYGYRQDGSPFTLNREQIDFGYRKAPELHKRVITGARFQFTPGERKSLKATMQEILARRTAKQPLEYPSCGSVFKRPPGHYAGQLIEEAGLKGARIGDAMVSPKHAGFIVNTGAASAADVYALIRRIETEIKQRFGVQLEREVRLIGDFDDQPENRDTDQHR